MNKSEWLELKNNMKIITMDLNTKGKTTRTSRTASSTSQARTRRGSLRLALAIASPLLLIGIGHAAARVFTALFGPWAWTGTLLVYWGSIVALLALFGAMGNLRRWLGRSRGSPLWLVLALVLGLSGWPLLLLRNLGLLINLPLAALWFLFALVNAPLEEAFWRGFLLDEMQSLPRAVGVGYSTLLFSAIHPLMLGVFARSIAFDPANPLAYVPFGIFLVGLSVGYALIYLVTKSLRLGILSHYLADLGSLSIFQFMNLVSVP